MTWILVNLEETPSNTTAFEMFLIALRNVLYTTWIFLTASTSRSLARLLFWAEPEQKLYFHSKNLTQTKNNNNDSY